MHVKYASRQELYPEPNVCDVTAARETLVFLVFVAVRVDFVFGAGFTAMREELVFVALDTVRVADVVVRAVVACDVEVGVVWRDTVARCGVADERVVTVRPDWSDFRDSVVVAPPRVVMFRDCVTPAPRALEFAARTAASATPMHTKQAVTKDRIPFILSIIIMITKNRVFEQVVFVTKIKKSRHCDGIIFLCVCLIGRATISFNKRNTSFVQIVWGHFNMNVFANINPNAIFPHFTTYSC